MAFQLMFAVITPALISGAFAERKRFKAFVVFSLLWATLVYDPLAHWVWGVGGWLRTLGALDFAGGTVVHISAGVSALVVALVLGRRLGFGKEPMEPHNVPYVVLGAGVLWFGWFGFNAGSALGANGLAAYALVNTHIAAAMAVLTWTTVSWASTGRPSVVGAVCGAVAGLVAITPAAGFVTPTAAILIGLGAGVCASSPSSWSRPVCTWTTPWTSSACTASAGSGRPGHGPVRHQDGQLGRGGRSVLRQPPAAADPAIAVVATCVFSAVVTFVLLKLVDATVGLRVSEVEEEHGLDLSQHGEPAYQNYRPGPRRGRPAPLRPRPLRGRGAGVRPAERRPGGPRPGRPAAGRRAGGRPRLSPPGGRPAPIRPAPVPRRKKVRAPKTARSRAVAPRASVAPSGKPHRRRT